MQANRRGAVVVIAVLCLGLVSVLDGVVSAASGRPIADSATPTPSATPTAGPSAGPTESASPTTTASGSPIQEPPAAVSTPSASAATDSSAVTPPSEGATQAVTHRARRSRLAVGDSLMVGAASAMGDRGFAVHAKVGRQFVAAPRILRSYGTSLRRNVVVELGTNGPVALSTCQSVVNIAGANRRVFLVTNKVSRSWEASNNATLRTCDRRFKATRVRVIDWRTASIGHPEWFAGDRIHTSKKGRVAFANLIDRAVDRHGY